MGNHGSLNPSGAGKYIASIDLGSHTARLLVCKIFEHPILFRAAARKRFYTNLAEGFIPDRKGIINTGSIERAVNAIEEFKQTAEKYSVEKIVGAATGVLRRAENGRILLNEIKKRTGIEIKVVSGEEEALLTLKGISHALGLSDSPDVFFDLGGSTTEFIYKAGDKQEILSLPIGAFVLTELFLKHDPPLEEELNELKDYVDDILKKKIGTGFDGSEEFRLIGSGGTVTSLAAVKMNLEKKDVIPDVINGFLLDQDEIQNFFESLKLLTLSERVKIRSIDEGRAEVIPAGTLAVMSVIEFFKTNNLTVSYSDMLEGLILSYLEGDKDV